MSKIFKKITILIVSMMMLIGVFTLTGCTADIDRKYNGFSSGFNFTGSRYYDIMSAVRSDKTEFNVDDVILDLYFGWFTSEKVFSGGVINETGISERIVFYITTNEVGRWIDPQDDYLNVENQFFITEVHSDKFATKAYAASVCFTIIFKKHNKL